MPDHRGNGRVVEWLQKTLGLKVEGDSIESRQGLWWMLNPSDYPQRAMSWLGLTDIWDVFHFRFAHKHSVIFDVGANFGYYAVTLASKLGCSCTVYAFEPNPPSFERLQKNIALNQLHNVSAHLLALSDKEGTASMKIRIQGNSGSSQLVEGQGVRTTTLDHGCHDRGIERLDLMKIDVEGFEDRVLSGGTKTLEK